MVGTLDWIVPVTEAERAAGAMSPSSSQRAYKALYDHGCVLLRGAYDASVIAGMRDEFHAQYGSIDAADMKARSERPVPNCVLNVGEARYEIAPRMTGGFASQPAIANLLVGRFLVPLLATSMRLSGLTVVVSYPGAALQHAHRDAALLYEEAGGAPRLPPHAINCAVPLIDVDMETGPTGVWLGSHFWPPEQQARPDAITAVPFQIGDCFLLDYRTLHTGMPNRSNKVRPIAYLVYARTWFFDEVNHVGRSPLNMTLDEFNALPKDMQPLLSRVLAQHMRSRQFSETT